MDLDEKRMDRSGVLGYIPLNVSYTTHTQTHRHTQEGAKAVARHGKRSSMTIDAPQAHKGRASQGRSKDLQGPSPLAFSFTSHYPRRLYCDQ